MGVGQRAEEHVHGHASTTLQIEVGQTQMAIDDEQVFARRDDVYTVGQYPLGVLRRPYRHRGRRLEQLGQGARVVGREVEDDHVGHAGLGGQCLEERLERLDGARRAAQGHHRQLLVVAGGHEVVDLVRVDFLDEVGCDRRQPLDQGGRRLGGLRGVGPGFGTLVMIVFGRHG